MAKKDEYDLMILGGGMAGLTAAIYGVRYNLRTVVIAKDLGGTANIAGHIENWPGMIGTGSEIISKVIEQAKNAGVEFLEGEVSSVSKKREVFSAEVDEKTVSAKSLIIGLGMQHRKLNIPGEKEFIGKGVSYCATCDGMFFKNKNVLVVGGSDSAAKAALYLSEIAKKVYVSYRKSEMRCEPISLKKLEGRNNVEINYFTNPVKILGEKKVSGIILNQEDGNKTKEIKLDVDGIFIEIGAAPVIEVVNPLGVKLNENGFIVIDRNCKTNIPGVFAAGDNSDSSFKQLVVAASEGAIAAKSAHDFLKFGK
jgi:thioredoxin-disulfide reductase